MDKKEIEMVYPANRQEWRQWLEEHHLSKQSVWLVQYKKKADIPTISWSEAVEEALCFGWIDSVRKTVDKDKFIQFFGKRKLRGTWSKVNKEKIKQLISEGRMMQAGFDCIEKAKQNGSWTVLDDVEALVVPEDLGLALNKRPGPADFFSGLSKSAKKAMLQWLVLAKREETRNKRIAEIATLAGQNLKPKQF